MKTVMLVFGTRPEAIKMCPLVMELKKRDGIKTVVCVSAQHRQMLDLALCDFGIRADFDLSVMKAQQTLFDVTADVLTRIKTILENVNPDLVLVHGDTSTSLAAALACFYLHIPVGHVEAGLRSRNIYSPFPEEFNRQAVSLIAKYNFAPTELAKANLLKEGKDESFVFVTGNTVIDALKMTVKEDYTHPQISWASKSRLVLITAHRRESIGVPMCNIFKAIRRVIDEHSDTKAIFPLHPNPAVQKIAKKEFMGCERIRLIDPLSVFDFHNILARSYMVVTDSGGIQEEATYLGKPVLAIRDTSERLEGIDIGSIKLVGTSEEAIYKSFSKLLDDKAAYEKMAVSSTVYGDGRACSKIADIIASHFL